MVRLAAPGPLMTSVSLIMGKSDVSATTPVMPKSITSGPGCASLSSSAARKVQPPPASAQTASPGAWSDVSPMLLTVNVASASACATDTGVATGVAVGANGQSTDTI